MRNLRAGPVGLALLLQSLWPAALTGSETCGLLDTDVSRDQGYYLSFRELPRLEGPELFEQLAKGEVKLLEKGQVGGNVAVFVVAEPVSLIGSHLKDCDEKTMVWMTRAVKAPDVPPRRLFGNLVWSTRHERLFVVLSESASWYVTVRVHEVNLHEPLGLRVGVFEDKNRKEWHRPRQPIAQTEIRLPGSEVCGPGGLQATVVDNHLRIAIETDRPGSRCPPSELSLDLESLEWGLHGGTVLEQADFFIGHRENIGERLRLCLLNSDETLGTRLACAQKLGEIQYLPAIRTLMKHVEVEDPAGGEGLQRHPAAWALFQFGMAAVPEIVINLLRFDQPEPRIREILLQILRQDEIKGDARVYVAGMVRQLTNDEKRKLAEALLEEL